MTRWSEWFPGLGGGTVTFPDSRLVTPDDRAVASFYRWYLPGTYPGDPWVEGGAFISEPGFEDWWPVNSGSTPASPSMSAFEPLFGQVWRSIGYVWPWRWSGDPVNKDDIPFPPGSRLEIRGMTWDSLTVDLEFEVIHSEDLTFYVHSSGEWAWDPSPTVEDFPEVSVATRASGAQTVVHDPQENVTVSTITFLNVTLPTVYGEPRAPLTCVDTVTESGGVTDEYYSVRLTRFGHMSAHHTNYEYRYSLPDVGVWRTRQRQSLAGADSWPLRQRQNGGLAGSWPLRQRQLGI